MNRTVISSKPEIHRVRLSSPFMVRSRCKFCMGSPIIYYYIRNPTLWFNPRKAMDRMSFIKKLLQHLRSLGFLNEPKHCHSAAELSHDVSWAKYRPRLHRTKGSSAIFDVVEFVTCDCMQTTWAYSDEAIQNRPEINHRKSRYRFPTKFEF
jgi:hypothetical protein